MHQPVDAVTESRPPVITAAVVFILLSALWTALLAIGHLGVEIPGVSALGPGGGRVVLAAGTVFAVAAVVYTVIAVGLLRLRPWAWTAAVVLSVLALLGGVSQFRGAGSVIGMLLAAAALGLLLTPQARRARCP